MGTERVTVFNRIVMDVIKMPLKVALVLDCVFPESALPYVGFPAISPRTLAEFSRGPDIKGAGEFDLDPPNSPGKIGVAGRQRPEEVNMVGQDHRRDDLEGLLSPDAPERLAQQFDPLRRLKDRPALMRHQREEERSPRRVSPPVIRHRA